MNSQQTTEQITDDRVIEENPKDLKVKNPRKVAAGKALADGNVKRRADKKTKISEDSIPTSTSTSIFDIIQKSAILVSSGFILFHGYNFVKESIYKKSSPPRRVKVDNTPPRLEAAKADKVKDNVVSTPTDSFF